MEKNELYTVADNELIFAQEVIQKLKQFNEIKTQLAVLEDEIKIGALEAMEKHGIKKVDNEVFSITYKAPTTRKSIDTEALKEQGLYELFLKETPVKSSVVIKFK